MIKKKKTLSQREIDIEVNERSYRKIKYYCIAFWSTIVTITAYTGHWADDNIDIIKAGVRASLDAWLKK